MIALRAARLCVSCDALHEDDTCPSCGSGQWIHLSRIVQPLHDPPPIEDEPRDTANAMKEAPA